MGDAGSPPPSSPSRSASHQPLRAGLPSTNPTKSFWQTSFPNTLAHHRSTPELPTHADVVVVGTGISGTFAVDELVKNDGLTVLALEARTLCSAATGRNGGHLQPLIHSAPAHIIDFELRNFHHVEALALNGLPEGDDDSDEDDEGHGKGDGNESQEKTASSPSSLSPSWCDFRRLEGCLGFWNEEYFNDAKRDLAATAASHVARDAGNYKSKNMPGEDHTYAGLARVVDDPKELEALGLRTQSGAVGAIVQSVAASLSPYKLCVGLWRSLLGRFEQEDQAAGMERTRNIQEPLKARASRQRHRLNLQTDTPVTRLERGDGGWIVHSPRGSVHTHTVVLATNAYTSHLVPEFAPLIRPVQAQMSALVPPPSSSGHCNTSSSSSGSEVGNPHKETHREGGTRKLIPMSYGFMGVGSMDRVMSDYLVQNPYITTSTSTSTSTSPNAGGGHLMFGGGRHLSLHHGEGVWDDDFVDKPVERYLRSLPERLDLNLDLDTRDSGAMYGQNHNHLQNEAGSPSSPSLRPPPSSSSQLLDIAASWTGIIGHSADGHPWVGAAPQPEHAGIFVCAGYTGHGMTNAPLCGRAVARRAVRALRDMRAGRVDAMEQDETTEEDVDLDVPPEYLITRERIERIERVVQAYSA
ncbi:uncharacterized protein Z520_11829 [Fonsecaea multimorphosa CBS 102226]|uniref:FAD dependent oxidoreductase domain-containing protein n=1 Tax=Fonsecaea multimorphosa CBS 102226 TaxID=1442371 RepID=A0A0D2JPU7_9EURO|nr:uncharacterized protein Z520_11829 [Fonsecaea multimorphosa CBS 102226]KIX92509.1 hypothetical protein Z520_11829 [Fonsecaea multimorphosa CBS 102226]OAL19622.1 hypothetical protein AYO22_09784 [Fonsecaea multimorphosa]